LGVGLSVVDADLSIGHFQISASDLLITLFVGYSVIVARSSIGYFQIWALVLLLAPGILLIWVSGIFGVGIWVPFSHQLFMPSCHVIAGAHRSITFVGF